MKIKRILLTGDDGYCSVGTRLLVRALKDEYDVCIAATKEQQTGMGGKISLIGGGEWGESTVDGVPAFWVDGSPADAMECAQGYFDQPFDLIISGVNWGANVTSAVISSGTYSAAVRGMGVQLAPRAMAISWDAPPDMWHLAHRENDDISAFYNYPGDILKKLVEYCIDHELWQVPLLNINLPKEPTTKIRFTKILKDITRYYSYPITVDRQTHRFSYQRQPFSKKEENIRYDAAAVSQGYVSVTPCAVDMTHFTTFEELEQTELVFE